MCFSNCSTVWLHVFLTKGFRSRIESVSKKNRYGFHGWNSKNIGVFMVPFHLRMQCCDWLKLDGATGCFDNGSLVGYDIPVIGQVNCVDYFSFEAFTWMVKKILGADFQTKLFLSIVRYFEVLISRTMGLIKFPRWLPGVPWFLIENIKKFRRTTMCRMKKSLTVF